jgi:hypothetical protein
LPGVLCDKYSHLSKTADGGQEMMKGKMAERLTKARRMSVCRIPTEGMKTRPTKRQPKKDPKRSTA